MAEPTKSDIVAQCFAGAYRQRMTTDPDLDRPFPTDFGTAQRIVVLTSNCLRPKGYNFDPSPQTARDFIDGTLGQRILTVRQSISRATKRIETIKAAAAAPSPKPSTNKPKKPKRPKRPKKDT
jgi:hypothetical protein